MRFKITVLMVIVCSIVSSELLNARIANSLVSKIRNYISVDYSRATSSSFLDYNGEEYQTIIDTLDALHSNEYSYNSKINQIGLEFSQTLFSGKDFCLFANAYIPYAMNNHDIKYRATSDLPSGVDADTVLDVEILYESSHVPFWRFGIGADYRYKNLYLTAGTEFSFSLLNEDVSYPLHEQYFDRYYSNITPSFSVLYKGAKSFLEFVGQYKMYIDSPISDMYKLKLGVGLTTVESSILGAFVEYSRSTTSIDNSIRFNPADWQFQEEYIRLGTNFEVIVEDNFLPGISYDLKISGKNTKNVGMFRLYLKILLDLNK